MAPKSVRNSASGPITKSPFFAPGPPKSRVLTTPNGSISGVQDVDAEPKSSVARAAFNLINTIVGAGIVGIPYAIRECSLVWGVFMVLLCALLTVKSLRLLIETAKHVDVPTYERLAEACFGKFGFIYISISMFIMSYGAMVGYLMIVKTALPKVLGIDPSDPDNYFIRQALLTVASLCIMFPLSAQRDVDNLSKTSTISVVFDCIIVLLVSIFSPIQESLDNAGGLSVVIQDASPDPRTFFLGLGVLCFAFVCQHSSFIIAGSLEKPTRERWNKVTGNAILTCCILATVMGTAGYLGFMDEVQGNILQNLGTNVGASEFAVRAAKVANGLLCVTMFFVYPMELFVARHVCVVLFFKGRRAHDGDDHSVLARDDRRILITAALYIISLVPALLVDDLGSVFSISGAVGGSSLSYIVPGVCYLGVHGSDFLAMVSKRWALPNAINYISEEVICDEEAASYQKGVTNKGTSTTQVHYKNIPNGCLCRLWDGILWYILLMPLWVTIANIGQKTLEKHRETEALKSPHPYRLGKIIHKGQQRLGNNPSHQQQRRLNRDEEDDGRFKPVVRVNSIPSTSRSSQLLMPLESKKPAPPQSQVRNDFHKIAEKQKDEETCDDSDLSIEPDGQSQDSSVVASESNMSLSSMISDTPQTKDSMDSDEQSKNEVINHVHINASIHSAPFLGPCSNHSAGSGSYYSEKGGALLRSNVHSSDNTNEEHKALLSIHKKPLYHSNNNGLFKKIQKEEVEIDIQDETPSLMDFLIAIFFILFGCMAAFAGVFSVILASASG